MRFDNLDSKIDGAIRFFLYVLIFWLPYSPAVVETCVIIGILLWVIKRGLYLKSFKPPPSPINKPVGFFLVVCTLSVLGSVFIEQSWHNFLTKTLEWFIVYFLVVETVKKREHLFVAVAVLLFTAAATALDGLQQFYITYRDIFLGHVIEPGGRATAGFKTSNSLGGYLTVIVPLSLALALSPLRDKRPARFFIISALFFVALWALAVTVSRGAWIGTFVGLLFLVSVFCFHGQRRHLYLTFGLLCLATALSVCFGLAFIQSLDLESLTRYITVPWRTGIWGESLLMIRDKPFLGHGINTYMNLFEHYRSGRGMNPTYAHNCYIQLAAETGILGLGAFLWIIGRLFRESLDTIVRLAARDRQLMVLSVGLLSGILAFLVHSFMDTNFYTLQLSVYFWFMAGLLAAVLGLDRPERSTASWDKNAR